MSEPVPTETDATEPLQFENADYTGEASGRLTCTVCHREIVKTYYEINGKSVCDECRALLKERMTGGSGPLRLARAVLFGTIAAVGGAALYFAVLKITGLEIALISILVGFMVGSAVRSGSRHRGGLAYQVVAILLTYTAIALSYGAFALLPFLMPGAMVVMEEEPAKVEAKPLDPAQGDAKHDALDAQAQPGNGQPGPKPEAVRLTVFDLISMPFLIFLLESPIRSNLTSPIGMLIIGFALWEAWKLNRPMPLVFNGPFSVGEEVAPPPPELPSHA